MHMAMAYEVVLRVHIAFGFLALLTYWIPVGARKGSGLHIAIGRIFAISIGVVSVTSFVVAALTISAPLTIHPDREAARSVAFAEFLFFLGLLTASTTWNGMRFIWCKNDLSKLRGPLDFRQVVLAPNE